MREALKTVSVLARISRGTPQARRQIAAGLALGALSGMLYPLLVATVAAALSRSPDRLLPVFLALGAAAPAARLSSQLLLDAAGTSAISELRLALCRQVLSTPLARLEEIGPSRLLTALNDDMATLATVFGQLSVLAMQAGVAAAALGCLAWLSPRWFLLLAAAFTLGIAGLRLPGLRTDRHYARARRETDAMFAHFRDLIEGSKELKLHRERRRALLAREIVPTGEALYRSTFLGSAVFTAASAWSNLLFFGLLGLVLFGASDGGAAPGVLAGCTFLLLYLRVPVEVLLQLLPALGRANAAAAALAALEGELSAGADAPAPEGRQGAPAPWRHLELRAVTHTYRGPGEADRFTLGPVSLELGPGEVVFLVGGNGSGKTTLAKILTGLYPPDSGQILLDGVPVGDPRRDEYRHMFSAVFSDFYLFETLTAPDGAEADPDRAAAAYLARLDLDAKVTVEGGRLSTLDLSQGQRKRLALMAAYLEDRPIYFFDEWAADQDPSYKQVFYRELLPELKARGKAVVVISHDDAYYAAADRLIKLTEGRIEWERCPQQEGLVGA